MTRAAGILDEYRKGTPIFMIRAIFSVGSGVMYRLVDRANLPRRGRGARVGLHQKRHTPHLWAHGIPAVEKVARMDRSNTWRAFFVMHLEGHGAWYTAHTVHFIRQRQRKQDEGPAGA